jgi:hypothetical protein
MDYFSSTLFYEIGKFVSDFPFLGDIGLIGLHKRDGLRIAEGDTLGVSITVITFDGNTILHIEKRVTKRTGDDAGPASDAKIFVNYHPVMMFRLPVAGLGGADLNAEGFFAVIAGHRKVDPDMLPFGYFDPGAARIADSAMKDGADHLALPAASALLMIHNQYLLLHFNSP